MAPGGTPYDDKIFTQALRPDQVEELRGLGTLRRYERGVALFHENQRSDSIVVIVSGRVKVSCLSEEGKEALLAVRGPGDLIGEMAALDGEPRSATAVALEPVEALLVTARQFTGFLKNNPEASQAVMTMLSRRLRDSDRKRLEFSSQDSVGRVAGRLVELAQRFGEEAGAGDIRIDLPISQEELAGWTGSSREAVSKALGAMRELGWLTTNRRSITLHDLDALRQRSMA
jgi:CRP/FNR family transcriptional regulator, cyclic AMP receptor protein